MLLTLLLPLLYLCGCSSICLAPDGPHDVTIAMADDANQDQALAIDLVFVTDETLAAQMSQLTARQYFERRRQLERDFPDGFSVFSWELAPGQLVLEQRIDPPCAVEAVLMFADFASPGDHRIRLLGRSEVQVRVEYSQFSAVEL